MNFPIGGIGRGKKQASVSDYWMPGGPMREAARHDFKLCEFCVYCRHKEGATFWMEHVLVCDRDEL